MISSMTGYGRAELQKDSIRMMVEVSSLNSRFLEVSLRLPRWLALQEPRVKDLIQEYVTRGRVNLRLECEEKEESSYSISLDIELVKTYYRLLTEMKEALDLSGQIDLGVMARLPKIFKGEVDEGVSEDLWPSGEEVIRMALEDLVTMRKREGMHLEEDMRSRIGVLEEMVSRIEKRAPEQVKEVRENLERRVQALVGLREIDPQRLAMEVALLAERCDVTEECVRLHSHHQLFLSTLDQGGAVGRRLNFILQEMHREANTIGAKADDLEISHLVVGIKEEIERLREQVQNVE